MTRLLWGALPPQYDQGVNQGVLYLDDTGVAWNGLVSVEERDTGELVTDHYFDGRRLHISHVTGDFEGRITAFTYPDEFAEYNGWSELETYKRFGFSYRTQVGENTQIHLVYNVMVDSSSRSWQTSTNDPKPSTFSWDIYGSAVSVPGARPASHLTMMAPRDETVLEELENILYGTATDDPRLPDPEEIIELYEAATLLRITNHGDGTYTASGPDDMVKILADGGFEIEAPTALLLDEEIFVVNSY